MRLISYREKKKAGVGVMVDDGSFVALPKVAPKLPRTLRGILSLGGGWRRQVERAVAGKPADYRIEDVAFDPLIPEPHALWALALNFQAHIDETGLTTNRNCPHLFLRVGASHVGHGQPIVKPKGLERYDYEGELAVIIARPGRRIPVDKALAHAAGFSIYNEGSVREYQNQNRNFGLGKNFEKSGSFGPWLMTADEFGDPAEHTLVTRLNGDEKQNCSLGLMIFNVPRLISFVSEGYTLRPGDVIVCGTPGAIPGKKQSMKHGDICEVEISGLGVLRNPVQEET